MRPLFFCNYKLRHFLITIIQLILTVPEMTDGSPHHIDGFDVHLNLHQEHHHLRVRNILLGISGTSAATVGAVLLYRWYTNRGRIGVGFDATFSERGALLPANSPILEIEPPIFQRWRPFNFFKQPGMTFSRLATPTMSTIPMAPIPKVYYNHSAAPGKAFYDPWEQL